MFYFQTFKKTPKTVFYLSALSLELAFSDIYTHTQVVKCVRYLEQFIEVVSFEQMKEYLHHTCDLFICCSLVNFRYLSGVFFTGRYLQDA